MKLFKNHSILLLSLSSLFFLILIFSSPAKASDYQNLSQYKAKKLYERITGVKTRMSYDKVKQMAALIEIQKYKEASDIAVNEPQFINTRARNFALSLSSKTGSLNIPINDTSSLILGVIRDNLDFRSILTGNFYYDLKTTTGANNYYLLTMANSFTEMDSKLLNYDSELTRVEPQVISNSINIALYSSINANSALSSTQKIQRINNEAIKYQPHPDPAGVLSTRHFSSLQLSGGTNRRAVEYVVNAFLCSNMSEIGNNKASDAFVGKDVDRFPAGNPVNYVQNCKSCHTILDSYRGAFAKVDYSSFLSDQSGLAGVAHGSLFKSNNESRALWLNSVFNEKILSEEISTKGTSSLYHKHLIDAVSFDATISNTPAVVGESLTRAQAIERLKFRYSTMLLAMKLLNDHKTAYYKTYTGNKTNIDTAVTAGNISSSNAEIVAFRNWILSSLSSSWSSVQKNLYMTIITSAKSNASEALTRAIRARYFFLGSSLSTSAYTFFNGNSALKAQMALDPKQNLSSKNIKENWNTPFKAAQYFLSSADANIRDSITEYLKINKATIDQIFMNKTSASYINMYSENCLNHAVTNNYTSFLTCEMDLNRSHSLLGIYLLSKISQNNSNEITALYTDLIERKGYAVYTGSYNEAINYWYLYLGSINNRVYFNARDFDGDSGVNYKMNRGSQAGGYTTEDDSFSNLASASYGWRGPYATGGKGLKDFGHMISDSEAFSKCMVKRLVKSICYIDLSMQSPEIKQWSVKFENSGYKVKELISSIASNNLCGIL